MNDPIPNRSILNRAGTLPADGWYEIETTGEHVNPEAKVVQVLDAKAFDAIVNRFKVDAAKDNFAGLLIDQDHFSLDTEKSSEAFGWLMELRNRDGHLEGRIDWTDIGEAAVKNKRYKFFSTVYPSAEVEKIGTRTIKNRAFPLVRPLALDRLALTNDPNNKGGKPISNRNGNSAGATDENKPMKSVLKKLGLAEDASEESAVAALAQIQNRATTAEGERDSLKTERDQLLTAQVESDLEKYKNRFKPENREKIKTALLKNRAGTIELLESIPEPTAASDRSDDPARITNRQKARTPEEIAADAKQQKEEARAARISNRARQIRSESKNRVSLSDAYQTAASEIDAEAGK